MNGTNGSRVRQAVVSSEDMPALRKGLHLQGEAFFSADGKEISKESFNRKLVVACHERARLAAEQELQKGKHPLENPVLVSSSPEAGPAFWSPRLYTPKELPLSSLKEIYFPQLEINKRHHGRVLFGTFCVQPFKLSSVITVLADKSGKAVLVSIFNLPPSQSSKENEAQFGAGVKVAIKEPYFKLCADGKVMVRVENPAELVHVDDSNEEVVSESAAVIKELEDIRAEGNRLFQKQNWDGAIEQYSKCITRSSTVVGAEDNEKIKPCLLLAFSNRSEVWLQLLNFKNALDDANKALEIDASHQKSISRRDRAWQGFGKVPFPAAKVKVPVEEPSIVDVPVRAEKKAAKGKPRDSTTASPASKVKLPESKGNPPPSAGLKVKGTVSKDVSPSTPPEASPPDLKDIPSASTPKLKGIDSKNSPNARDATKVKATDRKSPSRTGDASKVKATERTSISPSPKASKNKISDLMVNAALSTPTKGKVSDAKADPPTPLKGKLTPSSKRKPAVSASASGGEGAPNSDSKGDASLAGSFDGKLPHVNGDVPGSTVIESQSTDSSGDSSPSPRSPRPSKAKAFDWGSASPPPEESEEQSTTEPHKKRAGAIDSESSLFAAWLDGIRSTGDSLLAQGKWVDALRSYDRVTEFAPPKKNRDKVIKTLLHAYSHRSEGWIWLGNHEQSLRDADSALELVSRYPNSVVGFDEKHLLNQVRRGRAFLGLGEYEEACSIFTTALAKSPADKFIRDLLEKSKTCFKQSREGIYDLDEYFLSGCRGPSPPCSDFVGPVDIRRVPGKGRGLFLTKNVNAGDLLLVSNPLSVVRPRFKSRGGAREEDEDYRRLTSKWRRNDSADGLDDFVGRLSLLQSDRNLYQLYSLAIGPDENTLIPDINVFIPGSHFELPDGWENLNAGPARLRRIVKLNAVDGGLNPLDGAHGEDDEDGEAVGCVGLWALPSFMNHSCVPNCHMIDVGDAMFVRASRNIREGEELTRAYFSVYQNGFDRQILSKEWQFVCNCERCVLEKALTVQRVLPLAQYRKLLEKVREETLKRLHSIQKDRLFSVLLPTPQPAHLQLRKFADSFDALLFETEGLGNKEKSWICASHLEAYIARVQGSKDRKQFILALENVLEFMTSTSILGIGHAENALARAALLLDQVEDMYGSGSQTYRRIETRMLDLYRNAYGNLRKEVLLAMIKLMPSASKRL